MQTSLSRCALLTLLIPAFCTAPLPAQDLGDDGARNIIRSKPGSQKWALLIGVDDYINVNDLQYCGRDVASLRQRLVGAGFDDDQVFLMHDAAQERKYQPYKSNINTMIELLLGRLDDEGELVQPGLVSQGDLRHGVFMNDLLDGLSGTADREEGNRNHSVVNVTWNDAVAFCS